MKHLIQYRLFESTGDIKSICEKYGIQNFTINSDGSIDINGDVDLSEKGLDKLPLKFRNVTGNFICYHNKLTSLEGCPEWVGGNFYCSYNNLTSLEGCPESVGGHFYCNNNNLTSLEGGPKWVGGHFYCSYNNLTSLEGCPKSVGDGFYCKNNKLISLEGCPEWISGNFFCSFNNLTSLEGSPKSVGGNFICSNNNLISLEGAPESIGGDFCCSNNPVYQIWKLFEDKDKIELFNDMDIIQGDSIVLDRLIDFLDHIGKPKTESELRKLIKRYKFIL
jgi:hypothetical protein